MAWAEKIPGSDRWRGLYRDRNKTRHTAPGGPFSRESEAKRAAAVAEDEARRRPGDIDTRAGRQSWGAFADWWWLRRKVEPGTLARDASRRSAHLEPRWGGVRLDAISHADVQDWVDELAGSGLAPTTVARCYHLLSASFKAAVKAGRLSASPCTSIDLPRTPPTDERYLSWEEVEAVTHFLDGRDALLVWFLVGTGARWGEAVGAHLHRLDLDARRLDIHESWDQKTREVKPYPKGRAKRSVPLPAWLVDRLGTHLEQLPPASTCGATHRRGSRCRSGLIVPGRGTVIDYDSWRRTKWAPALARAGITDVRIHDLRHSYASWLIQDGVTLEALADLLGHSSVIVTARYSHLADSQWDTVRAVLDAKSAPKLPQQDHGDADEDRTVVRFRRSNG